MKYLKFIGVVIFLAVLWSFAVGDYQELINPIIKGKPSGVPFTLVYNVGDPTADTWILGDTTAAGMYVPEQAWEITDVKVFGDPDSGDTLRVIVYAANGAGANETVATTARLCGTTWAMIDDTTPSSTYKTITTTEGMGVLVDFIAGTPNKVQVIIEGKTRINDAYE